MLSLFDHQIIPNARLPEKEVKTRDVFVSKYFIDYIPGSPRAPTGSVPETYYKGAYLGRDCLC